MSVASTVNHVQVNEASMKDRLGCILGSLLGHSVEHGAVPFSSDHMGSTVKATVVVGLD